METKHGIPLYSIYFLNLAETRLEWEIYPKRKKPKWILSLENLKKTTLYFDFKTFLSLSAFFALYIYLFHSPFSCSVDVYSGRLRRKEWQLSLRWTDCHDDAIKREEVNRDKYLATPKPLNIPTAHSHSGFFHSLPHPLALTMFLAS